MRRVPLLLASMSLAMGLAACGASDGSTAAHDTSRRTSATGEGTSTLHVRDRDGDVDHNDDDYRILGFGHAADVSESQTITTLIDRYFADAVARDGAKACSLLTPFIEESVVEGDGQTPELRGNSCAAVLSKLFTHHHQELVGKRAGLKVMRIGIGGNISLVALEFSEIPVVREITLQRVGDRWTVRELLDGLME
jgi:hypothetical protein